VPTVTIDEVQAGGPMPAEPPADPGTGAADAARPFGRLREVERLVREARRTADRDQLREALRKLAAATAELAAAEEELVRAAQAAGLTNTEIAQLLGRSQPAISQRYPRPDRRHQPPPSPPEIDPPPNS
jgi:DNA-directed RNA polymerase specialized sigma24 family protein